VAAFPAGYYLDERTRWERYSNVQVDRLDDGTVRQRVLGDEFVDIKCVFRYLTLAEKNTLKAFLVTNKATTVTWTIDSIDYSGQIVGDSQEGMSSQNTYELRFTYRATEV